jgi:hypothetical protein
LRVDGVLRRFGWDLGGFRRAAESLGGESQSLADAAFRIPALPKVPLYYLLWEGDDEFEPRVSVLFDRSIEQPSVGGRHMGPRCTRFRGVGESPQLAVLNRSPQGNATATQYENPK